MAWVLFVFVSTHQESASDNMRELLTHTLPGTFQQVTRTWNGRHESYEMATIINDNMLQGISDSKT